jgi:hypothetical protein
VVIGRRIDASDALCQCGHVRAVHQGPGESCTKCYGCDEFETKPNAWGEVIWFVVSLAAAEVVLSRVGARSLWWYLAFALGGLLLFAFVRFLAVLRRGRLGEQDSNPSQSPGRGSFDEPSDR